MLKNAVKILKISVIIANKRREEKLATSTFNIWMRSKSMSVWWPGSIQAMMTSVRLLVCLHFKEKGPTKHHLKCLKDGTLQYAGSSRSHSSLGYIDYKPFHTCRFRQINHCLFLANLVSGVPFTPTPSPSDFWHFYLFDFLEKWVGRGLQEAMPMSTKHTSAVIGCVTILFVSINTCSLVTKTLRLC